MLEGGGMLPGLPFERAKLSNDGRLIEDRHPQRKVNVQGSRGKMASKNRVVKCRSHVRICEVSARCCSAGVRWAIEVECPPAFPRSKSRFRGGESG